jgi:oligopeptide/dipeptide ABC transporter ATP-binding protein
VSDLTAFQEACRSLIAAKWPYDLIAKTGEEMRTIQGNKIAMIFQDPMQALNPVFPIGDQIAENILLHQRGPVAAALVERMELEEERDAIADELAKADPTGESSPAPLPMPRARPILPTALGLVWLAATLATGALYVLSLLGASLFLAVPGLVGAMGIALAAKVLSAFVAAGTFSLRPWAPRLGVATTVIDLLVKFLFLLLPTQAWFRLVLLAEALIDGAALYYFLQRGTAESFQGRWQGWRMVLHEAEGDTGELLRVRDLVAGSRLNEPVRETLTARLDALIARANTLVEGDRISGNFYPLLPRSYQRSIFSGLRDKPRSGNFHPFQWIPGLRRLIDRPLYDQGFRWAVRMLRRVRIPDPERIARQFPYELSGGMQQRALIAIALSCNPRLLVADEPTTALDVTIQAQILELIKEIKRTLGTTVLIITHDLGIIADMCDRVCVMYAGIIAEDAPSRTIFKQPLHPYTQGLMKAIPSHTERKDRLEIIEGSVPNLIKPPTGCRFHPRCPMAFDRCSQVKPPAFEVEPGHRVACLLFEEGMPKVVTGGERRG